VTARKFKPTYAQLALFNWLMESDRRRFLTHWSGMQSQSEISLYETVGVDDEGKKKLRRLLPSGSHEADIEMIQRLGGRRSIQMHQFIQQGFIKHLVMNMHRDTFDKFTSQFAERNWHYAETILLPTDKGREWWAETGKALFEAERAKREAGRAAVERMVLLGRTERITPRLPAELKAKVPSGIPLPLPAVRAALRPQATARVVKETGTRLYLADVKWLRSVDWSAMVVEGRAPNEYVAKEHVIMDRANPSAVEGLLRIDAEYVEDVDRIAAQAVEAILPALTDLDSRLKQKEAERDDMIRELLEEAKEPEVRAGGPKR